MKRQAIRTRVLLATAMSILIISIASADTIYVPDDRARIQWAVDNATGGDTIIVRDGTYTENVDVSKQLTIRSENGAASTTVQAANSSDHVFNVNEDYTNISGFHVTGATSKTGIFLDWANYCNITDNCASDNAYGIRLCFSDYNTFVNNSVNSNTGRGFELLGSNHNTLQNNTAKLNAGNNWSCGICAHRNLGLADYNTIVDNTVNLNGGYGGILLYNANNSYIAGNTINSNTYGIYVRSWSGWTQTSPGSSDHNTITDNKILDNSIAGVVMASLTCAGVEHRTESNTIYNNYFANTDNIYFAGPKYENTWNIGKTTGLNIVGGRFIGGNYWSDYEGDDTDSDGFGEEAYNIGDLNQDYLPLVMPMCGDITGDGNIDTVDLLRLLECVVTGTPVDLCIGDIDGNGKINVLDVRLLMGYIHNPTGYSLHCGCGEK
ncbi:MAG: NosD domain-containing protein [Euryarchaeota archaeon]|nr:NosD domain-containing protein [Euryarchaeota archaeon]